ncbi:hypothetical protein QFC21_002238 [Naganishia friedmannii]|uniref:Uncharacterized protein n=1 Tax=Naganishia friedmannii TaxID=89922 RepID=A0ACC2VXD8_9TREE|nr:hypothetical protein QFC21_002238 [Naganishia friedmannii]
MSPTPSHVLPHALKLPIFKYLKDKRVVLASSSPRRREILEASGLKPDIVPSTFPENLPHGSYSNAYAEYPIATAGEKAMEVYERLIRKDEENAPELVISADTVIIFPPQTNADAIINNPTTISKSSNGRLTGLNTDITSAEESEDLGEGERNGEGSRDELSWSGRRGGGGIARILEKPADKKDQPELIKAYVENGEGIDRAGGFAVQGLGGFLVKSIQGDYNNVVGFPSSPFWRWMGELYEDGVFSD